MKRNVKQYVIASCQLNFVLHNRVEVTSIIAIYSIIYVRKTMTLCSNNQESKITLYHINGWFLGKADPVIHFPDPSERPSCSPCRPTCIHESWPKKWILESWLQEGSLRGPAPAERGRRTPRLDEAIHLPPRSFPEGLLRWILPTHLSAQEGRRMNPHGGGYRQRSHPSQRQGRLPHRASLL